MKAPGASLTALAADGIPAEPAPTVPSIWRAPLVPVAVVVTGGILVDRVATVPMALSCLVALAGLAAWLVTRAGAARGLALVYLALAWAALGAAYHHWHLHVYAPDEIGRFATTEPRTVRLRGVLDDEPHILWQSRNDPLQSMPRSETTLTVLRATALHLNEDWVPVSGRVQLRVPQILRGPHVGDEVEVVGWLQAPLGPANPGEADGKTLLGDQRIRTVLRVRQTPDAVILVSEQWPRSLGGWLAVLRGWGQRQLQEGLPEQSGLATALLLGEGSTLTGDDWERYKRTGVIHALAISGQHLVVLAVFFWWGLRVLGVRRRRGAVLIALLLLGYALLAGGRAPVLRAAVMVCVGCGALLLRRPVLVGNVFALSWLVVLAVNPTDLVTPGCQLSFLGTAVLYWGTRRGRREQDPVETLVEKSRPVWQRLALQCGRLLGLAYLLNLTCWLAITPLVVAHYQLIPLPALLIGPPVTLLVSVALVAGFLLFPCAAVCPPLVSVCGLLAGWCLTGCDMLVRAADQFTEVRWYVGSIPLWWLYGLYLALFGLFLLRALQRRWRWLALAGVGWLCVGLVSGSSSPAPREFRCTFLSVGHGGCTVLETPDGRTLLYDAGALNGPDVTRRHIAPFLWHRGIRRIDELLVSHADLDHFNGIVALLERFALGQVTWTPSFTERATPGIRTVVDALTRRGIPIRRVAAGDQLAAGEITLDVLHPPWVGPAGNENARSLVLLVQYAEHRILLTGDLEAAGLEHLLSQPSVPVDVLQAPHHGSRAANPPALAAWARPRLVVSSQGVRTNTGELTANYRRTGAYFLDTAEHGAITLRVTPTGLVAETYRTNLRIPVAPQLGR